MHPLYESQLHHLDHDLQSCAGLELSEVGIVVSAAAKTLSLSLHRKLCRLLVVELNTARTQGRLEGGTPEARWADFITQSSTARFWTNLSSRYPTLLARVTKVVESACGSALVFARAWAQDREALSGLCGAEPGCLTDLRFAAGDSHRGGRSVALLTCEGGQLVYKPRPVEPEQALAGLLAWLEQERGRASSMRVPQVLAMGDYGWTAFISHVHASNRGELRDFYEGIGQWLALMRLLGGTDLHAENLIAQRRHPVIVDGETLFTPKVAPIPTGLGDAVDEAMRLVSGTVLATGLLPNRGEGLGWRGVDASGVGALPAEQPSIKTLDLIDGGTDRARIGHCTVPVGTAQNHPAAAPALMEFWPDVLAGFDELSRDLREFDRSGRLQEALRPFKTCQVRVVTRPTETYAELAGMLWHPVSLHDEPTAVARAQDLLGRMAGNVSIAPGDPQVIEAEVADLLVGDIPYFSTRVDDGSLEGPGGVHWLAKANLADQALEDWRSADLQLERDYVRATLISAYASETRSPVQVRAPAGRSRSEDLEHRRRRQAASIMRSFVSSASRGRDGTLTWVASTLTPTGWSLQPIGADLYGGLSGVALVAAAYVQEETAGRADPVEGSGALLQSVLRSLERAEDQQFRRRSEGRFVRPPPPGGFLGLGSQIWVRLMLEWLSPVGGDDLARAVELARGLQVSAEAEETLDVLAGRAGALVPLLALARRTGDETYISLAEELGEQLLSKAERKGETLFWRDAQWPEGLGGFAHGVSGVGWALGKLGRVTGQARFLQASEAAFRFEVDLFDVEEQNWLDLRMLPGTRTSAAWCHGCVGIGLARIDLDPTLADPHARLVVQRAVRATEQASFGWTHCACHGDVGAWEFLDRALATGEALEGRTRESLLAQVLTGLEDQGSDCGTLSRLFQPGLLAGQGGVLYQLLRFHPQSDLPSFLTPGVQPDRPSHQARAKLTQIRLKESSSRLPS